MSCVALQSRVINQYIAKWLQERDLLCPTGTKTIQKLGCLRAVNSRLTKHQHGRFCRTCTKHGAEQCMGYLAVMVDTYYLDRTIPVVSEDVYCLMHP